MIRHAVVCLLALSLSGLAFCADDPKDAPDEPPVLLKKKKKPAPAPDPKPKEGEPKEKVKPREGDPKDEPKEGAEPAADPKEVLERINKNIRESEERLRKKDPGGTTQRVQRDIVKDLDSLIKKAQEPPPPSSSSSSSSSTSKKDGSESQSQQTAGSSRTKRGDRQKRDGDKNKVDNQAKQGDSNKNILGNGNPKDGPIKKADSQKDIWGHLPEAARLEMDAYSREQFSAKYAELLKQYYQTLAEKGRRKTEEPR